MTHAEYASPATSTAANAGTAGPTVTRYRSNDPPNAPIPCRCPNAINAPRTSTATTITASLYQEREDAPFQWRDNDQPMTPRQREVLEKRGYEAEDLAGMPRRVASRHIGGELTAGRAPVTRAAAAGRSGRQFRAGR